MKKLIIQIPCFNEEETLPVALQALPRVVDGVGTVEWLVIDDGSSDRTVEVARQCGVDHVVRHTTNMGLAVAFMTGLAACVERGADVIVNTDADNQYDARDIPKLVAPIIDGKADIVIGERPIRAIAHFSGTKKLLQKFGSWVVRVASHTQVPDAPSGFRAISRDAAQRLHVFNDYTYTLETIIQAGHTRMAVASVPVGVNRDLRPSRLVRGVPSYVARSLLVIVRTFATYHPYPLFLIPGILFGMVGLALGVRFLYYFFQGDGAGHVQSIVLTALLLGTAFFLSVIGAVADLVSANRKLLERANYRLAKLEDAQRALGAALSEQKHDEENCTARVETTSPRGGAA